MLKNNLIREKLRFYLMFLFDESGKMSNQIIKYSLSGKFCECLLLMMIERLFSPKNLIYFIHTCFGLVPRVVVNFVRVARMQFAF